MIQEKKRWSGDRMIAHESFDVFYTRKLEALKNELKSVIKGDLPYVTDEKYACSFCACRIKLHSQGQMFCMMCIMPASLMPSSWPNTVKTDVFRIMTRYPSLEAAHCDFEALQQTLRPKLTRNRDTKAGDAEFGKQIREARIARGWSLQDMAGKILKSDGKQHMSPKSIEGYENGRIYPREHILEQIKQVLGIEGWQTWDDIERDLKG